MLDQAQPVGDLEEEFPLFRSWRLLARRVQFARIYCWLNLDACETPVVVCDK